MLEPAHTHIYMNIIKQNEFTQVTTTCPGMIVHWLQKRPEEFEA